MDRQLDVSQSLNSIDEDNNPTNEQELLQTSMWTHANVDDTVTEDLFDPISLKVICIQKLSASIIHRMPMSLMEYCMDYMAWNDGQ